MVNLTFGNLLVFCMKLSLLPPSDVVSQCRKHLLSLFLIEFAGVLELGGELCWWIHQVVPEASGGHGWCAHWKPHCTISALFWRGDVNLISLSLSLSSLSLSLCVSECAEKLFDLVDSFAESTKRKAAVWPLQIILLILCPDITQDMSRDTSDDSKDNKANKFVLVYFSGSPLDHYYS